MKNKFHNIFEVKIGGQSRYFSDWDRNRYQSAIESIVGTVPDNVHYYCGEKNSIVKTIDEVVGSVKIIMKVKPENLEEVLSKLTTQNFVECNQGCKGYGPHSHGDDAVITSGSESEK